jgi:hypothetical protein
MMSLAERNRFPPDPVFSVIVVVTMVDRPLERLSLLIATNAIKIECSVLRIATGWAGNHSHLVSPNIQQCRKPME